MWLTTDAMRSDSRPGRAVLVRARARTQGGATSGLLALAAFAAMTVMAEVVIRLTHVAPFVLPPPSMVLRGLADEPGLFARHAMYTVQEAGAGLVVAAAAALLFAAAALHSRFLDRVLTPLVVVSQTIPVIALAPLLVLWFGYGALPRVVVCALIAFFPMAVTALQGFRSTDPQLLTLLRSVNASRWDVFWRVRVPGAAPFLAAGFRTGVTLSLVGAVVAEWIGTDRGLGYLVLSANSRMATAQAFAAVLVITVLGLAAYGGSVLLERKICWWNLPVPVGRTWNKKEG
jgi:ABC-type nitrate/sulfonate/bicarbonate transport system permease component